MNTGSNKWDERYAIQEYAYGEEPNAFLKAKFSIFPNGPVLCVADGEGRNGVWLAKQGFIVTSIDYSLEGIRKSKLLAHKNMVQIIQIQADLLKYDFKPNSFTAIISIYSHFILTDMQYLHKEYIKALKPGGIILMEAFSKNQFGNNTGGPKKIELLYDLTECIQSFPEMALLEGREIKSWKKEGIYHHGESDILQLILQKPE